MKLNFTRLLTLAAFLVVFISSKAQDIYFSDDFESGLGQWTMIDGDTDGYNWELNSYSFSVHSGSFAMASFSWISTPGGGEALAPDNFAISTLIDLTGLTLDDAPINLTWWHVSPDPDWDKEKYYVYLADSFRTSPDTTIFTFDTIYSTSMDGINSYEQVSINMTPYIGSKFHLVFHHDNSQDKWHVALDDIRLSQPITYDIGLVGFNYDNPYFYGSIPSFLFDSIPVDICAANYGTEPVTSVSVEADGELGPTNFDLNAELTTRIDADSFRCWRGNIGVGIPLPGMKVPVTRLKVDIPDQTDLVTDNNELTGDPLIETMATISERYYTAFDSNNCINWEIYYDPNTNQPTNIFVDYTDPDGYTYIGDRMTEITSALVRDPNTDELNKAVLFGTRYDIKPNDRYTRVTLDSVLAHVSPKNAGGFGWVEVYDYYNWTNTVGDPIEPLYTSDTLFVPFAFADEKVHTMAFKFPADSTIFLNSGRYIIAVAEADHSEAGSIGLAGARADWFNWEDDISFLAYRGPQDTGFYKVNPDFLLSTQSGYIDYMWCMGIYVSEAPDVGIADNIDLGEYVEVYPNPANGFINVVMDYNLNFETINVKDIAGRTIEVVNGIQNKKNVSIDLSNYENGIYFIEIANTKGKAVKKIIKQ